MHFFFWGGLIRYRKRPPINSCMLATAAVLPGSSSTLALPPVRTPSFHWTVKLTAWPLHQGERTLRGDGAIARHGSEDCGGSPVA